MMIVDCTFPRLAGEIMPGHGPLFQPSQPNPLVPVPVLAAYPGRTQAFMRNSLATWLIEPGMKA